MRSVDGKGDECGILNIGAKFRHMLTLNSGPIDTPMIRQSPEADLEPFLSVIPMNRAGAASEVGELIAWLLCDGSKYITGTVQSIDGGWACH